MTLISLILFIPAITALVLILIIVHDMKRYSKGGHS